MGHTSVSLPRGWDAGTSVIVEGCCAWEGDQAGATARENLQAKLTAFTFESWQATGMQTAPYSHPGIQKEQEPGKSSSSHSAQGLHWPFFLGAQQSEGVP